MSPLQKTHVSHQVSNVSALWHQCLGHRSSSRLKLAVPSFCSSDVSCTDHCHVCPMAKQTRLPFPISSITINVPFDLIHCDIWGPYKIPTHTGVCFFLTIVDGFNRCTWVFLMIHKFETQDLLKSFITFAKTPFQGTVKTIRVDNGSEILSMRDFFRSMGIELQHTCIKTPQ